MAEAFVGTIQRSYQLEGNHVVILRESYEGEVEIGDWIAVELPGGDTGRGRVKSIAWGSAFDAQSPPLTLVVEGLTAVPEANASVRGAAAPGAGAQ
jgi:hypothetical protein